MTLPFQASLLNTTVSIVTIPLIHMNFAKNGHFLNIGHFWHHFYRWRSGDIEKLSKIYFLDKSFIFSNIESDLQYLSLLAPYRHLKRGHFSLYFFSPISNLINYWWPHLLLMNSTGYLPPCSVPLLLEVSRLRSLLSVITITLIHINFAENGHFWNIGQLWHHFYGWRSGDSENLSKYLGI